MELKPNSGKNLIIEVDRKKYARIPVKTHLITPSDKDPAELVKKYTQDILKAGDIVFISEKIIAVMQGRSYPLDQIKTTKIAAWLASHVYKNPGGIGLASPQTMQLAIEEAGLWRILLAAGAAAITKPFGIRGMFYHIAGYKARSIDGAVPYAIPPYNNYVSKGPLNPQKTAEAISQTIAYPIAIIDANDFGINILGASKKINKKLLIRVLKDNPLGQTDQSTPIGILREL